MNLSLNTVNSKRINSDTVVNDFVEIQARKVKLYLIKSGRCRLKCMARIPKLFSRIFIEVIGRYLYFSSIKVFLLVQAVEFR